jgi:hypothetical protein
VRAFFFEKLQKAIQIYTSRLKYCLDFSQIIGGFLFSQYLSISLTVFLVVILFVVGCGNVVTVNVYTLLGGVKYSTASNHRYHRFESSKAIDTSFRYFNCTSKNIPSSQIGHEKKSNYDLITGKAAKGLVVAGKKVKKSDAYKSLADYVTRACKTQWDPINAKSRYDAYLKTYKEAARESRRTGFGNSEEDEFLNIRTIEETIPKETALRNKSSG